MHVYAKPFDDLTDYELNYNVWKFEIGDHGLLADDVYLHGFVFETEIDAWTRATAEFMKEYCKTNEFGNYPSLTIDCVKKPENWPH